MTDHITGRITRIEGAPSRHRISFILEYGPTRAQITLQREGPLPTQGQVDLCKTMLAQLGVVAQEAAASPQTLSWPDHLLAP